MNSNNNKNSNNIIFKQLTLKLANSLFENVQNITENDDFNQAKMIMPYIKNDIKGYLLDVEEKLAEDLK